MMTFEDIVQSIEVLPPLSNVVFEIQDLYSGGDDEVDVKKLIKLIESDVTLTADVLKFVNAPKYGFSKKISSVSQAVTLLGTEIIYGTVVNNAISKAIKSNPTAYGITSIQFNDMCHLQSALIFQWYSYVDARDAQFLTPLALIMEIGKLIISKEVKASDYGIKFRRGLAETDNVAQYEYSLFDTTSYQVSAMLFKHWNIDKIFVEILYKIDFEDKKANKKVAYYRDILDVIRTAINVKSILSNKSIEEASELVDELGFNSERFRHIALRLKKHYEQSKGLA